MLAKFKALGDFSRLRLINLIMIADLCMCEIEVILEMSQSNVSRHVAKLKSSNMVESYKDAQWTHFRINPNFKVEHKSLYDYLEREFTLDEVFIRDRERYAKYRANGMNCTLIREDRDKVMKIIL